MMLWWWYEGPSELLAVAGCNDTCWLFGEWHWQEKNSEIIIDYIWRILFLVSPLTHSLTHSPTHWVLTLHETNPSPTTPIKKNVWIIEITTHLLNICVENKAQRVATSHHHILFHDSFIRLGCVWKRNLYIFDVTPIRLINILLFGNSALYCSHSISLFFMVDFLVSCM